MSADQQDKYLHVSGCSGSGKTLVINTVLGFLQPAGNSGGWQFVTVDAYQAQTVQLFCRTVYEVKSWNEDVC